MARPLTVVKYSGEKFQIQFREGGQNDLSLKNPLNAFSEQKEIWQTIRHAGFFAIL